ncbi:hypothetical protein ACGFRG_08720 [Streptomyces sp. NPDC048696]|uniref:hypothetical protein n=1 Tax=Streptomyces sp. NPDC048696 TaxID=3365585 RepID=UPI00371FEDAC
MNEPNFPQVQAGTRYVLTDAAGRTFSSSAPIQAETPTHPCSCGHAPVPSTRSHSPSPATLVVAGAGGALVVGTVLVALLLSIAVVAASIAVCALAITVCAVVLRSLVNQQVPRGRYRRR